MENEKIHVTCHLTKDMETRERYHNTIHNFCSRRTPNTFTECPILAPKEFNEKYKNVCTFIYLEVSRQPKKMVWTSARQNNSKLRRQHFLENEARKQIKYKSLLK